MGLVGEWELAQSGLPEGWSDVRVLLKLEEAAGTDRVVFLLAPMEPLRSSDDTVAIRVVRDGEGPSPASLGRALARLDKERLHGTISVDTVEAGVATTGRRATATTLVAGWDAALANLPTDWSDLLGEIELDSSDYLQSGTVCLAPINPRLVRDGLHLEFRSARCFGYGASAGMVRRCLERCDDAGISGTVQVLRALSDSHPVGTQGPVWQIDGRMV